MKVCPGGIASDLPKDQVTTVPAEGWASIKNGKLLALVEKAGFEVVITGDKNMQHQQDGLDRRPFAVFLLSAIHWPTVKPHVQTIVGAVEQARPGQLVDIPVDGLCRRDFAALSREASAACD